MVLSRDSSACQINMASCINSLKNHAKKKSVALLNTQSSKRKEVLQSHSNLGIPSVFEKEDY